MKHFLTLGLVILTLIGVFAGAGHDAAAQANPAFSDCSIASLTGNSQSIFTGSNANRKYLYFCNTGNANVGINLAGGTAAIAGTGTMTLVPGACKEFSSLSAALPNPPFGPITAIGTSGQPLACFEGK